MHHHPYVGFNVVVGTDECDLARVTLDMLMRLLVERTNLCSMIGFYGAVLVACSLKAVC